LKLKIVIISRPADTRAVTALKQNNFSKISISNKIYENKVDGIEKIKKRKSLEVEKFRGLGK